MMPDLHAQGEANVNVAVEGTMSKPRITGRATRARCFRRTIRIFR